MQRWTEERGRNGKKRFLFGLLTDVRRTPAVPCSLQPGGGLLRAEALIEPALRLHDRHGCSLSLSLARSPSLCDVSGFFVSVSASAVCSNVKTPSL